jgi:hypothetical protein
MRHIRRGKRPRGKDWGRYFAAKPRGSLPKREDLPLENRPLGRVPPKPDVNSGGV